MNRLSLEARAEVLALLVEGASIRSVSRTTGRSQNTTPSTSEKNIESALIAMKWPAQCDPTSQWPSTRQTVRLVRWCWMYSLEVCAAP
jgi:hypothetical protein